jgi:nicotinamidase-related amidase
VTPALVAAPSPGRDGALLDGDLGAEVVEGLGRRNDDIVVRKKWPSGFFVTDLALVVRALDLEQLLGGGVSTNWAVESTVRDGHSHDLRMTVVSDAVATPFTDLDEPSLRGMAATFADVVRSSDVLTGGPS